MRLVRGLLVAAYPFLVFAALRGLEPRFVALALGLVLVARGLLRGRPSVRALRGLLLPGVLVAGVLLGTAWSNDPGLLLAVPTLVNAALLLAFGRTLLRGPTMVETFARLQVPDLPEEEVDYCRTVTLVWCVFFLCNGGVALWLATWDAWLWTLYTGLVAYLLVGLVFGVEFVVRSWRFGRYEGTLVEPLFRRLFPHGPAA